jgi:hypothetical protein
MVGAGYRVLSQAGTHQHEGKDCCGAKKFDFGHAFLFFVLMRYVDSAVSLEIPPPPQSPRSSLSGEAGRRRLRLVLGENKYPHHPSPLRPSADAFADELLAARQTV